MIGPRKGLSLKIDLDLNQDPSQGSGIVNAMDPTIHASSVLLSGNLAKVVARKTILQRDVNQKAKAKAKLVLVVKSHLSTERTL